MNLTMPTVVVTLVVTLVMSPMAAGAITIFSDAGADAGAVQDTVDAYRAALGNPNNANNAGPLSSGRREINWDGGGPPVIDGTAPVTPFTVFENLRGATFTTPGIGLTQAAATGGLLSLDLINPTYADLFAAFSPNRLFTPLGSNITDGSFSIPGTGGAVPAEVRGFGAIFSDVDIQGETTIEFIGTSGNPLGTFVVPAFTGNQTFSFLGVITGVNEPLIGSVRIVTGTAALGPNESSSVDLAVMDDVLYAEPQVVPEPWSFELIGLGLIALAALRRRYAARRSFEKMPRAV
jgi:hypothetical protein